MMLYVIYILAGLAGGVLTCMAGPTDATVLTGADLLLVSVVFPLFNR